MSDSEEVSDERYSDFFVTVNTHEQYQKDFFSKCWDFFRVTFNNDLAAATLIFDDEAIHSSEVKELTTELSKRQKLMHFHFIWELKHSTTLRVGPTQYADNRGLNKRLQDYFNEALQVEGLYVHASVLLDRSRAKNYARKEQQNRANEEHRIADRDINFGE